MKPGISDVNQGVQSGIHAITLNNLAVVAIVMIVAIVAMIVVRENDQLFQLSTQYLHVQENLSQNLADLSKANRKLEKENQMLQQTRKHQSDKIQELEQKRNSLKEQLNGLNILNTRLDGQNRRLDMEKRECFQSFGTYKEEQNEKIASMWVEFAILKEKNEQLEKENGQYKEKENNSWSWMPDSSTTMSILTTILPYFFGAK